MFRVTIVIAAAALALAFMVSCDRKATGEDAPPSPVTLYAPTNVSYQSVTLTWSRSLDEDFAGYQVHAGHTPNFATGTYSRVASLLAPDDTTAVITNLAWNSDWYFKVRVMDQGDLSSWSNEVGTHTLMGPPTVVITSPVWGATINGPIVQIQGTVSDSTITAAFANVSGLPVPISVSNGQFVDTIPLLPGGNYISVEAASSGGAVGADTVYVTSVQSFPPTVNITEPLWNDTLPATQTTFNLAGTVAGNTSNIGYMFINGQSGYIITASGGAFIQDSVPAFAGDNTIVVGFVNGTGFGTDTVEIYSLQVVPRIRVQVTWNTNGTDIDTHIQEPDGTHIWYMNQGPSASGGSLDVDDTDGYGPENYRAPTPLDGTYLVYVHDFPDTPWVQSETTVRIFFDEVLARTFGPIAMSNDQYWDVCYIYWPSQQIVTIMQPHVSDGEPMVEKKARD